MRTAPAFLLFTMLAAVAAGAACGDDDAPSATTKPADAGVDADASTALCVDGKKAAPYPPAPYEMEILGVVPPGLTFQGVDGAAGNAPATIKIDDYFDPCAAHPKLLIVRSSATWCGPCQWQAAHTKRFMEDPRFAGRLLLLDLLVADEDNVPARAPALERWAAFVDHKEKLAIDPDYQFGPALLSRAPLPEYVVIDTSTMTILFTMSDPDPESITQRLAIELAGIDKLPRPEITSPTLIDGHFTENQMDLIRGMKMPTTPPPDPTNEFADSPAAVTLGKALFNDKLLSPSGNVACVTCHDPQFDLTDKANTSTGVAKVDRNSPAIALASHSRWQFWDGRIDTLWGQALGPPEDAKEIGSSRLFIAHQLATRYEAAYNAAFGVKYPLPVADIAALPASGKPGDSAYDALSAADKEKVTRVYVNMGKAIAAFERALRVKPNALDRYIDGDTAALTTDQKHALTSFFKNGCAQCHWGPRLTDDAFHNVRFGTGRQDGMADPGRETGLKKLAAAEFAASSKWSDAPASAKTFDVADAPAMLGAFKTPTLRGLPTSAPYGHGGTLATLLDVTHQYGIRGLEHADPAAVGSTEQWAPNFDSTIQKDLPAFLDVLTGQVELPP